MARADVALLVLALLRASAWELNTEPTTPWGPAWSDTILSYAADFVVCEGPYALCYYAGCESKDVSGDWIQNATTTASCPCEVHDGLYMVMINAILDKDVWRSTREKCPMGTLSCKLPNSAPACDKINKANFIPGAERISTFAFDNLTNKERWPFEKTDCGSGPFAACMTAPCRLSADGKAATCECPVYDGPFQVQASNKCDLGRGKVPSGFRALEAPTAADELYALLPSPDCKRHPKICYQSTKDQLTQLSAEDEVSCVGQKATILKNGSCQDEGFGYSLGMDPVFTTVAIYMQRPGVVPPITDHLERCEKRGKKYSLSGKKALVITTSHRVLGNETCTTCKETGVSSPEMTVPYLIFRDAGMDVAIATIRGGEVPVDSVAKYFTHWDVEFWNDATAIAATKNTKSVDDVDFTSFDLIYMAGGWGASYDLG
ncbi:unnamed protein product [Polarella glacialis]|uniref:Uncharacterized protein n=1 Tax=Polarella glacialis TaxID=89957 RepID=A0A813DZN9_POLGL|nr:unnamed protein product [Polarella glacialis]